MHEPVLNPGPAEPDADHACEVAVEGGRGEGDEEEAEEDGEEGLHHRGARAPPVEDVAHDEAGEHVHVRGDGEDQAETQRLRGARAVSRGTCARVDPGVDEELLEGGPAVDDATAGKALEHA